MRKIFLKKSYIKYGGKTSPRLFSGKLNLSRSLDQQSKVLYSLLDRHQRGLIRSVLVVIIGWLVGNAVFSEIALRIFLIFCMKLGNYKGRKLTEPDFSKKILVWRYSRKGLKCSPKSDTFMFFLKTALTIVLVFRLKLVINMTFNLNETYFSEKFVTWRYLTSKLPKNCPNLGFWLLSRICVISFL